MRPLAIGLGVTLVSLSLVGCDSDISGERFENTPPNTELSIRDASLVENLGDRRLTSTVEVSWSGTDSDGFVPFFEIRFYSAEREGTIGPEDEWSRTASLDTLVLLPIDEGASTANVVFEVRAIDNHGLKDPTPARTVFPIVNSPPTIKFNAFELPPQNTFPIIAFSWVADDPEGTQNIDRIEVSFNDTTNFVALPPETEFASFVGDLDGPDRVGNIVSARVHLGRNFLGTDIYVPGLRLDEDNVFYIRAVDKTDAASTRLEHPMYVWEPRGDILLVNDYRKLAAPIVEAYHFDVLSSYLPEGIPIDIWDVSEPIFSGNTGVLSRGDNMPSIADPVLRAFLATYSHIYWVATATTSAPRSNNFPFAASVMDQFFEGGGTILVHSPVTNPTNEEEIESNAGIVVLPLSGFISFPDSLRPSLRLTTSGRIASTGVVELPTLSPTRLIIGTLPYIAQGTDIPIYTAEYQTQPFAGGTGMWTGSSVIASISEDNRIALFALPIPDERTGEPLFIGADGSPDGAAQAVHAILERLGFPRR
ncbi:MAG TPA: hypothetical protein VMO47_09190 [Rhodothermales bacterium]|nr:hypothetical protein [Rhodothermales bacterium]